MRNALSVVYALLLTGPTCSAQQRSVKANISVDPDDAGNPPGKYCNINKGNADGLMVGDVLTVKVMTARRLRLSARGGEGDLPGVDLGALDLWTAPLK